MQKHIKAFKRDGYTVFEGLFDRQTIELWKTIFDDQVTRQPAIERARQPEVGDQVVLDNLVEREPKAMLPAVTHPVILDFLERVMGPVCADGEFANEPHGFRVQTRCRGGGDELAPGRMGDVCRADK